MNGKKNKRLLFLIFFSLFFLSAVSAQLLVSVESIKPLHQTLLYTNEITAFKITAINLSNERIVSEKFKVLVGTELALLEKNKQVREQLFMVPELLPNQALELDFTVKALSQPSENAVISVNYGQNVFLDLTATRISIEPSPLLVTVKPKERILRQGQASKLIISLQNVSDENLQSIRSELLVSHRVDSLAEPFEKKSLTAGKNIEGIVFEYWPKPLATGEHELAIQTRFVDSKGLHTLDHRVKVHVPEQETGFFWLGLLIIVLIIGFVLWKRTISKPLRLHSTSPPSKPSTKE